jgi:hypothetical protein
MHLKLYRDAIVAYVYRLSRRREIFFFNTRETNGETNEIKDAFIAFVGSNNHIFQDITFVYMDFIAVALITFRAPYRVARNCDKSDSRFIRVIK